MGKRIVVALGGNALQAKADTFTAEDQQKVVEQTMKKLVQLVKDGHEIVLVHGNGPQVGNIMLQQQFVQSDHVPPMPLDTCDAMSQGMIGYWFEKAIDQALKRAGMNKKAVAVVTQVVVDPADPAFLHPSKPIGLFYSQLDADVLSQTKGYCMKEDSGRGWRRVVPSPKPIEIMEIDVIRDLLEDGHIVIAGGGGGIPVVINGVGRFEGIEAVVDKDLTAVKIAEELEAEVLLILTAVDHVYIDYGKKNQRPLVKETPEQMRIYMKDGHFAEGSMLPKVEAAIHFAESKQGRVAIITSPETTSVALSGRAGTQIENK